MYSFGPFETEQQAKVSQSGYLENLIQEGAAITFCQVKQLQPMTLTVLEPSDQTEGSDITEISGLTYIL